MNNEIKYRLEKMLSIFRHIQGSPTNKKYSITVKNIKLLLKKY